MLDTTDYIAIQNLIHLYPRYLDAGDLVDVGNLFAHADVYYEGREEPVHCDAAAITNIMKQFVQLYEGRPRTRHIVSNLILESDAPNSASASSTLVVFQQTADFPLQAIITGDYHDRFAKVDGQWRFAQRRISNDLYGDLSAHGKYTIAPPPTPASDTDG